MKAFNYQYKIGTTGNGTPVKISAKQLQQHMHVVASSGRGKSSLLELIIRQMIQNREGFTLIDPHGSLYDNVVAWITRHNYHTSRKIHLIEPKDINWTYGINPLYLRDEYREQGAFDDMISERIYAVMDAIAAAWDDEIKSMPLYQRYFATLQYVLASHDLALSEITEIIPTNRQLVREALTEKLTDPLYKDIWIEMGGLSDRDYRHDTSSALNRVVGIFNNPRIREMFGKTKDVVDLQTVMDDGDIVLVNLATSPVFGSQASEAFGKILINTLMCAAKARVPDKSRPHFLFIDECYKYLSDDIANILVETRKFGLHLILAHHFLGQLKRAGDLVYDGVLSGAQTKVVLGGLSPDDARVMADIMDLYDHETPFQSMMRHEVVGHEMVMFRSAAKSSGMSETHTHGDTIGQSTHMPEGEGMDISDSVGSSTGESVGYTSSETEGMSEGLRPILKQVPGQLKSPEVLRGETAQRLQHPGKQSGYIKDEEQIMQHVHFDTVPNDRSIVPENIETVKDRMRQDNPFLCSRESVQLEMKERQEYLLSYAATKNVEPPTEKDLGQELDWVPGED